MKEDQTSSVRIVYCPSVKELPEALLMVGKSTEDCLGVGKEAR